MNLYFLLFLIVGLKQVNALDSSNDDRSGESGEEKDTGLSIASAFGNIGDLLDMYKSISKTVQPNITIFGAKFELPKIGVLDLVNFMKEAAQRLTKAIDALPKGSCKNQLVIARELLVSGSIKEWVLQLIDASAKISSGMLDLNLADFGGPQQCLRISENISDAETVAGKYCVMRGRLTDFEFFKLFKLAKFINPSEQSTFLVKNKAFSGICVPGACAAEELQSLLSAVVDFVAQLVEAKLEAKFPLTLEIEEQYCYDGQPRALSTMNITCLVILVLYFCILLVCSCWHIIKEDNPIPWTIKCFSLKENSRKLFSTDVKDSRLSCLNGLRVLSMMLIAFGHEKFVTSLFPVRNPLEALVHGDSSVIGFVAAFAVETFFLMSGMLVVYLFFTFNAKWFMVVAMYPARYLRLLPMLAITILINLNSSLLCSRNMPTFCTSHLIMRKVENCDSNWWLTLLFVQNYVDPEHMCIRPSWFLAVDTQLFWVSPVLLYGLKYCKRTFLFLAALAVCAVSAANGYFTYKDDMMPIFPIDSTGWALYQATHLRFYSWLIGAIFGYVMVHYKNTDKTLSKAFVIPFWIFISVVLCGTVVYVRQRLLKHLDTLDQVESIIVNSTVRQLWAVAVSLLIFLCSIGSGGLINKFLSLPVFTVISRVTYSMYLLHSYVIIYYRYGKMIPDYHHDWELAHHFLANATATLLLSIITTVSVEMPLGALTKALLFPKGGLKEDSISLTENGKKAPTELVGKVNPVFIE